MKAYENIFSLETMSPEEEVESFMKSCALTFELEHPQILCDTHLRKAFL